MRALLMLLAAGLSSAAVGACGGSNRAVGSASGPASNAAATRAAAAAAGAAAPASGAASSVMASELENDAAKGRYLKDRDHDVPRTANVGYRDSDDHLILAYYGRPASPGVRREVSTIVKRYYALGVADDGSKACAMILPSTVRAIPLNYGRLGPAYLHSAKTCTEVLARMFKHLRRQLSVPVAVTGVLVKGENAYALLGSARIPASFITLLRWHGAWKVEGVFGGGVA